MSEKIPYEQVMERMKLDIDYIAEEAYAKGYEMGEQVGGAEAGAMDYQKGLDDAWEAAKRVCQTDSIVEIEEIGLDTSNTVTWTDALDVVMKTYTAAEVIEKLKAYEEKKKADSEIKIGDEVIATNGKAVVYGLFTDNDKTLGCRYLYSDGSIGWNSATTLTKTGRHFPQIAEVLKAMKEVTE